jgi:hypothetical protein
MTSRNSKCILFVLLRIEICFHYVNAGFLIQFWAQWVYCRKLFERSMWLCGAKGSTSIGIRGEGVRGHLPVKSSTLQVLPPSTKISEILHRKFFNKWAKMPKTRTSFFLSLIFSSCMPVYDISLFVSETLCLKIHTTKYQPYLWQCISWNVQYLFFCK